MDLKDKLILSGVGICVALVWATKLYALDVGVACFDGTDCPDASQFCAKPPGNCNGQGICEQRPEGCVKIYEPVCGCDADTYGNACEAAAAGENVVYPDACMMGGTCLTNADCNDVTMYCAKVSGNSAGEGVCKERPQLCPLYYEPVCGSDKKNYTNECEAAVFGVTVAYKGTCTSVTPCFTNADCSGPDEYCEKALGDCDVNKLGVCETMPEICIQVYDPVCGCDGNTYSNVCEAASLGENPASQGECVFCEPTSAREKGRRCFDGLDNDCDALSDCDDPDCRNNKVCNGTTSKN